MFGILPQHARNQDFEIGIEPIPSETLARGVNQDSAEAGKVPIAEKTRPLGNIGRGGGHRSHVRVLDATKRSPDRSRILRLRLQSLGGTIGLECYVSPHRSRPYHTDKGLLSGLFPKETSSTTIHIERNEQFTR